jgi:hypothetical protein
MEFGEAAFVVFALFRIWCGAQNSSCFVSCLFSCFHAFFVALLAYLFTLLFYPLQPLTLCPEACLSSASLLSHVARPVLLSSERPTPRCVSVTKSPASKGRTLDAGNSWHFFCFLGLWRPNQANTVTAFSITLTSVNLGPGGKKVKSSGATQVD